MRADSRRHNAKMSVAEKRRTDKAAKVPVAEELAGAARLKQKQMQRNQFDDDWEGCVVAT